eukprot:scaffold2363_cov159-Amphora_coffeaeformis.AAC.32
MESPLYVLATSAASEWNNVNRVSLSPPPHGTNTPPTRTIPHISFTPGFDAYLASLTPGQVASPATGPPLRVKQIAYPRGGRRLDPLAVSLIELVLSKGTTSVLKLPIFPYSYKTEPTRCMLIRTHLLRRYAPLPNASQSALVAATAQLLHVWGATLVNATGDVSSPLLQEPQTKGTELSRMVSPLKRNNTKHKPNSNRVIQEDENGLSPFIVKDGSMGIIPESLAKETHLCTPEPEVAETEAGRQSSKSTAATTAPRAQVPVSQRALGKDVLCGKYYKSKRGHSAMTKKKNKKKQKACVARLAVQRLVRRWSPEERALYLQGLEQHGLVGSTSAIFRMIPGKSYEQIHKVGLVLQDEFGKNCAQPLSDAVRQCFE